MFDASWRFDLVDQGVWLQRLYSWVQFLLHTSPLSLQCTYQTTHAHRISELQYSNICTYIYTYCTIPWKESGKSANQFTLFHLRRGVVFVLLEIAWVHFLNNLPDGKMHDPSYCKNQRNNGGSRSVLKRGSNIFVGICIHSLHAFIHVCLHDHLSRVWIWS